jgi:UPF0042 nucleotide-binding protein
MPTSMATSETPRRPVLVAVTITSFGYRHAPAPLAEITLDVRRVLHDPHMDPQLRDLTGLDDEIREHVSGTPGALGLAGSTARQVADLVEDAGNPTRTRIDVAIGCAGGRHRSVVLAEMIAVLLRGDGLGVEVAHRDLNRPVLPTRAPATETGK